MGCFIDTNHELFLLANYIAWCDVEKEFSKYYCTDNGCRSALIRMMVGLMLLKSTYYLNDEGVICRWLEYPYIKYFAGEKVFQKLLPIKME